MKMGVSQRVSPLRDTGLLRKLCHVPVVLPRPSSEKAGFGVPSIMAALGHLET